MCGTFMQMKKTDVDALWRTLRQPFAVPAGMDSYHTHQFELFDIDAAGCLICGFIHRCSPCVCKQVVQTDDAMVCLVTGYCVETKIFADTEYSDTIASYNVHAQSDTNTNSIQENDIENLIKLLLTSKKAMYAHTLELQRFRHKLQFHMASEINEQDKAGCVNLVDVVQKSMAGIKCTRFLNAEFEMDRRQQLVQTCATHVCHILNTCVHMFQMYCKPSEMRMMVFGLMYLMRNGVMMQNIQVVPRLALLQEMLPSENCLLNVFEFRAKYITDVENKFKFLFRSLQANQLKIFITGCDRVNR